MGEDAPARILAVCTANIARSPLCAAMLQAAADRRTATPGQVVVDSAGVWAQTGRRAADGSRWIAGRWGLNLEEHRSRPLTQDLLSASDLVLTMEERHRDAAVHELPGALPRTFTVHELARLVGSASDLAARVEATATLHERVAAVATAAHQLRPVVLPSTGPEDLTDPYGGPDQGYVTLAKQLVTLLEPLVPLLFGPVHHAASAGQRQAPSLDRRHGT